MGHREDIFDVIEEAVQLYQQLAADCPMAFNPSLPATVEICEWIAATSLHSI